MTNPIPGETYSLPERIHGIRADLYWIVTDVSQSRHGHVVTVERVGTDERKTIHLSQFQRRALHWREALTR